MGGGGGGGGGQASQPWNGPGQFDDPLIVDVVNHGKCIRPVPDAGFAVRPTSII